jgi:hypothetical protein
MCWKARILLLKVFVTTYIKIAHGLHDILIEKIFGVLLTEETAFASIFILPASAIVPQK